MSNPQFEFKDISAETFGKYQFCTMHSDGMYYADCDVDVGVFGVRFGALPSPHQPTSELTARARKMHERAAAALTKTALGIKPTIFDWFWRWWHS